MSGDELPPLTVLSPVARSRHPSNAETLKELAYHWGSSFDLVEVFGFSEVAAARNHVATEAVPIVQRKAGVVLWLDSDMVADVETVILHAQVVQATDKVISGRAVMRRNPQALAASLYEREERHPTISVLHEKEMTVRFQPILAGMACLMMTSIVFLDHMQSVPTQTQGKKVKYLATCPRIERHKEMGSVFISEDHAYSIDLMHWGGPWLAEIQKKDGAVSWLDYGHILEQVGMHAPRPSILRPEVRKA